MALLTVGILSASAAYLIFYLATTALAPRRAPKGLRDVPVTGTAAQMGAYPQNPAAVKEIFDKQSQHSSSRAPSPVVSDFLSGGMRFLLMPYSFNWRTLRAIVHKLLTPKSSNTFMPSQEFEAKQLLWDILVDNENQEKFHMHIRRYTTSVVMTSTYGRRVPVWGCEDIREIYGLMQVFSDATAPGSYITEAFPVLNKLPAQMQLWRKAALQSFHRQVAIWMKYWTRLKTQMDSNQAPECFVKQFIETDYERNGIGELQASFVAGTMIEAGSETTSSALDSCVKYFAAYPKAQAKAYNEVRRVVGENRLPAFEDERDLPYIRAYIKEILRIRPVTNIGSPHYTTADIVYKDYFIPANSVVSINHYALHFDPERYTDPDDFIPDRYLNHPLKAGVYAAHPDPYARDHFDFGAGRRICPGMHLAENSLFITIACIIWAFDILPLLENGKVGTVDVSDAAYEKGANTLPKPSKLRFVPRSSTVETTLRTEWQKAKVEGYMLG
ncbi:putative O-methylsterigmatocystin oxidoreductase [Aspergillus nomiae NRRL 13137]|uniref:Putative O-methylsterigmatocystin oxidoreductase n=1 Tax=Aspergillus nomiae NRRL (strain ATCC 15546 / NRRL 13137 / CBS 260.88 / M93) TaxID=1509407 RepID=A0A0L1IW67_ASPN3|nr:putative O-methylsterigmatocystin oxidoreductase [Aspergillus nomiae NRRL 13137]KNG83645.1 putative O-methylsterigmatocystin oxidoreductase [Aspergillus nomiae NRRL 13137]